MPSGVIPYVAFTREPVVAGMRYGFQLFCLEQGYRYFYLYCRVIMDLLMQGTWSGDLDGNQGHKEKKSVLNRLGKSKICVLNSVSN